MEYLREDIMTTRINGKEETALLLEKLNKTIEKNNELTADQNDKMVKYTKGLFWLTIAIGVIAIVQVVSTYCLIR